MLMDIPEAELIPHIIMLASCIRPFCFDLRPAGLGLTMVVQSWLTVGVGAGLDVGWGASWSGGIEMVAEGGPFELGAS